MQKKVILLSKIDNKIKATPVSKEVLEAVVFLSIRHGVKNMMIVNAQTNELLCGEEEYVAANDRGDTEAEVMSCDPESSAITSLAQFNNRSEGDIPKEYGFDDPNVFERDTGHAKHLPYADDTEFEGTTDSYKNYGRVKPVYYIEFEQAGKTVKAVIDGWKYVCYAKANGISKVFACKLSVGNDDDLLSIMLQLQRSNHDSLMALFYMIQARWEKHHKGQGYRSDAHDDKELDEKYLSPDGRKLNIYERIGLELNLSGNRVKHIRKIGLVNPDHFEQIENSRSSLYAAYLACVSEERGEEPPVPGEKPTRYITDQTEPSTFSSPTTTAGDEVNVNYIQPGNNTGDDDPDFMGVDDTGPDSNSDSSYQERTNPPTTNHQSDDTYIIVEGICTECGKLTKIKINKNRI